MSYTYKIRKYIPFLICFVVMPIAIFVGIQMITTKRYALLSILAALLACIPFLLKYEKQRPPAREVMLVAIMCALAIASRVLFAFTPAFKPITAIVIICGMAFGKESGFLCGAMSALVSNMFFGQGPWTPFQMLSWGMIGYLAGVLNHRGHLQHGVLLYIYGAFAGGLYSILMDIWSAISIDGAFHLQRYLALLVTSLPFMLIYMISNIVFLALLWKPMLRKLIRIRLVYGLDEREK